MVRGELMSVQGPSMNRTGRDQACMEAAEWARQKHLPLIGVVESWTPFGTWGFAPAMALSEQAGRWIDSMEHFGFMKVFRVEPNPWRQAIHGRQKNHKKEVWEQMAIDLCLARYKRALDHNQAESVLITEWGSRAAVVGEYVRGN